MRYALLAVLLVGCSEKKEEPTEFACTSRIECPNQRAPASLDQCNDAAFDETCGAAYRTYFNCFRSNLVCDGRGQLDEDASAGRCRTQLGEWSQCVGGDTGAPIDTAVEEDTFVPRDSSEEDTATEDATSD
jgi:hypothetical protein